MASASKWPRNQRGEKGPDFLGKTGSWAGIGVSVGGWPPQGLGCLSQPEAELLEVLPGTADHDESPVLGAWPSGRRDRGTPSFCTGLCKCRRPVSLGNVVTKHFDVSLFHGQPFFLATGDKADHHLQASLVRSGPAPRGRHRWLFCVRWVCVQVSSEEPGTVDRMLGPESRERGP